MATEIPDFLVMSAPWLTAVGAVGLGYLNYRRSSKMDDNARFENTITELHALYHSLVEDLGSQVERLRELNVELTASNVELLSTITELRRENAQLGKTIRTLTARVKQLEHLNTEALEAAEDAESAEQEAPKPKRKKGK